MGDWVKRIAIVFLALALVVFSPLVLAQSWPNPGHPAGQVGGGTFNSSYGGFTFPGNLSIVDSLFIYRTPFVYTIGAVTIPFRLAVGDGTNNASAYFNASKFGILSEILDDYGATGSEVVAVSGRVINNSGTDSVAGSLAGYHNSKGWYGASGYYQNSSATPAGYLGLKDYAVYGDASPGQGGFAGYFEGNVTITNNLSVGTGSHYLCLNGACRNSWPSVSGMGSFYDKTAAGYTGSFSYSGLTGYEAGDAICNASYAGTHLCSMAEISYTIATKNLSSLSGWTGDAWIATGPAKYSPAAVPVNDCNGFTHGSSGSYLGNWWTFSASTGGVGKTGHCGNSLSLGCCI